MEQIAKEFSDFCGDLYDYWLHDNLFTWRWWVTAVLAVAPWIVWFFIRKKDSAGRLLCVAFFVGAVAVFMNVVGGGMEIWAYKVRLLPIVSGFLPWDLTVLPVVTMICLQFFPKMNPFIKAAIYAAMASFILEPLSIWLGFSKEKYWSMLYDFPVLYGVYLLSHVIATRKSYEALNE